jgi:Fe-S cluster biogenesis protein NfuA
MFIQTEITPNPQTLKFIPGENVTGASPVNFADRSEAAISPLAMALFEIPEVKSVFLGFDFVTITKEAESDWEILKPEILMTIMDHFVAGKPILLNAQTQEDYGDEDELVKQIREIIETRVRPAVAQDGGDIIFRGFTDGIVMVELHGACSGCPSSSVTLKNGIENMLKYYVPEVIAVEAVV